MYDKIYILDDEISMSKESRKGCMIAFFDFFFFGVAAVGLYFHFFHISNTIVIHNRTNHEIESVALRVRAVGVTYTEAFYAVNLSPYSRLRSSVEPLIPPRPEVNLSLYVQIGDEEHRIILSGYMDSAYGSFRVNITETNDVIIVNVQFKKREILSASRWQRQIKISLNSPLLKLKNCETSLRLVDEPNRRLDFLAFMGIQKQ